MTKYENYIKTKLHQSTMFGFDALELNVKLFNYQKDLVRWALRRGRAAIFADTGLGKTAMQAEWADRVRASRGRVLILAPLAVAEQTVLEARKFGVVINYRRQDQGDPITITNYDMMENFSPREFAGVVLDESSILKAFNGATRNAIIAAFRDTPFRLACTATPSPNDFTELGNHSEFLGIKTRSEMLAEYFVHDMDDTQDWRLKGHAVAEFWRWVSSWGALVRKPSDLGYSDEGFNLPPLLMREHIVEVSNEDAWTEGLLFAPDVKTLSDQRATRRATMEKRVELISKLQARHEPLLVWCELNDEGDMLQDAIKGSRQVRGADDPEDKARNLLGFAAGDFQTLITKPSIAGFGMNWQHCALMSFMGASHSYEQTYQAIRRCWRFGQKRPVEAHIVRASTEGGIVENYRRKEADAQRMAAEMAQRVKEILVSEIRGTSRQWNPYQPKQDIIIPAWAGQEAT